MSDLSRRSILVGLPILALVPTGRIPLAAEAVPATGRRLALGGYDPVSYFTDGHPEKGSADHQASYDDATYWFKTPEHRATFVADPDHSAPQFQGFCTVHRWVPAFAGMTDKRLICGKHCGSGS